MANKITVDRGVIDIFRSSDPNSGRYQIRVAEAGETRDNGYSEWILQLQEKTWMQKETLYKLAQLINKHCPSHKIDWRETFLMVEDPADGETKKTIDEVVADNLKKYNLT